MSANHEFTNVIDYGQYRAAPNVCPGCNRCRDCGRSYPAPVWIPSPFGFDPWIAPWHPTYSGDTITITHDQDTTIWANPANGDGALWSFTEGA